MKTKIKNHGIIKKETRSITFPCTQSEFEKFDNYFQENPCDLNSALDNYIKIAAEELDKNNFTSEWPNVLSELRNQEECSPTWYAINIIFCAHSVRNHISKSNAKDAAYMMGLLVQYASHWDLRLFEKVIFSGIGLSIGGKKGKRPPKYPWKEIKKFAEGYFHEIYGDDLSNITGWTQHARTIKHRTKTKASIPSIVRKIKELIKT